VVGQEIRRGDAKRMGDRGEQAERGSVHIGPDERADDARHRIGQEEGDAEQAARPDHAAVEHEGEGEREAEHDRHLNEAEGHHMAETLP
jgi:hypothetical protein